MKSVLVSINLWATIIGVSESIYESGGDIFIGILNHVGYACGQLINCSADMLTYAVIIVQMREFCH